MDSRQFIASCINSVEHREIHGRTPEELNEWKLRFIDLQSTFDEALVEMLYTVKVGDLPQNKDKARALIAARQNVLDHLDDL